MGQRTEKFPWSFIVLGYGISWVFWIPSALAAHDIAVPRVLAQIDNSPFSPAAFGPSLAALILALTEDGWGGVGRLLKGGIDLRFHKVWLIPILLLPPLIFTGANLLSAWIGKPSPDLSVITNPPMAIVSPIIILLTGGPLQEEFGWRGYALPRLQHHFNALTSGILLGVIWWLWHLPVVFIPGRFMVGSLLLFSMLMVEIVLASILFTWINNNTGGSVLAALLFHTSMNWSIWVLLPSMAVNAEIIGLTSLLLLTAVAIVLQVYGPQKLARAVDAG